MRLWGRRVFVSCSTETLAAIFLREPFPHELVLAHRRVVFLPWTCGYHRGATTLLRLRTIRDLDKELQRLLEETIDSRGRRTIDYDHYIRNAQQVRLRPHLLATSTLLPLHCASGGNDL